MIDTNKEFLRAESMPSSAFNRKEAVINAIRIFTVPKSHGPIWATDLKTTIINLLHYENILPRW